MSAEQRTFPPVAPGPADPRSGPLAEVETLRLLVNQRLAAAVDDILGLFGKTVARYREQIDRQQRQLDRLRSGDADRLQAASWVKNSSEDELEPVDPAAHIKTEAGSEDCADLDRAGDAAAPSAGRLLSDHSDTEDSGDCWRELWRPEETRDADGAEARSSSDPSQEASKAFGCKMCSESFQRKSHLLTHASAHLSDCGVCGKRLERGENLRLHLRLHRETAIRCAVCGQSFTLRGNLRMHMRIHSGERPFGCTVCGKSFGRRATLVRHVRSHTGEKPFSCAYCGRGFVEKGNLTVHLRTHTGEKPYRCSACERSFSQLSCFYKHPCQRGLLAAPT